MMTSAIGQATSATRSRHDVVVIGGGSAGLGTAASLLRRQRDLDIAVIEPAEQHYYQPGWTMVGRGVFTRQQTVRPMKSVVPKGVTWLKASATSIDPSQNSVTLSDGSEVQYGCLVVAPGLKLNWQGVAGLAETLGRNGVTSNYRADLAPYTWELVQNLERGTALFTQPPMPIKCAGAPQKAMYLSCDHWRRTGRLTGIDVAFHNAGSALFGVKEYVPPLMRYIERYGIDLRLQSKLIAIDGAAKEATFEVNTKDDGPTEVTVHFDMIHVCPPQIAPEFLKSSGLTDAAGWIEVDHATLRNPRFGNVFGLGDACSAPNAKTAAAVRKQAPVVAENLLAILNRKEPRAVYDGYGSCPLTVEKGRIVLAEFGYGGRLLPSFPQWLIDGTQPSRLAWLLKSKALPWIYWNGMLKGREWLAAPQHQDIRPPEAVPIAATTPR